METTTATTTVASNTGDTVAATTTTTPATSMLAANSSDWTTSVPDKFKGENGIKHDEIFKSYTQLEQKLGKYGLPPEAADKYEFTPKDAEGKPLEIDATAFEPLKVKAFESGLSQKQFEAMAGELTSIIPKVWDHFAKETGLDPEVAFQKTSETLQKAWGNDFDKNQSLAQKAFNKYASDNMDAESLGRNPEVMMLLAKIGADMGEDKGAIGANVNEDIEKLKYSPAYFNRNHPDHARVNRIVKESYGLTNI